MLVYLARNGHLLLVICPLLLVICLLPFNLGQKLPANTIILLEGNLGAGKTTLVQGIGAGLGISSNIVSPTFTIIIEYTEGRLPLYHLDLYRLSPSEAPNSNQKPIGKA